MALKHPFKNTDLAPILQGVAAALALLAAFGCFLVLEASVRVELAVKGAEGAAAASDPETRVSAYLDAARLVEDSWARPLTWHAGATEAESFIAAAIAATSHDREYEQLAVSSAARSVAQSPIQPAAWARLAAFAIAGRDVPQCTTSQCLMLSWRAASITEPPIECARMRIAYRVGELRPGDPRFDALDQQFESTRAFAGCLSFLPRQQLFQLLLRRQVRLHAESVARKNR